MSSPAGTSPASAQPHGDGEQSRLMKAISRWNKNGLGPPPDLPQSSDSGAPPPLPPLDPTPAPKRRTIRGKGICVSFNLDSLPYCHYENFRLLHSFSAYSFVSARTRTVFRFFDDFANFRLVERLFCSVPCHLIDLLHPPNLLIFFGSKR